MKRFLLFIFVSIFSISLFAKTYSVSNAGKEFIKKHESCMLTAYWDSNGYSIGYGHHGKDVYKGMKITQKQANKYFDKDIQDVNASINRLVSELNPKLKLSQKFIDGLGDLIYNCGEGGVRQSHFFARLKRCRPNNQNDINFTVAAVKTCRVSCPGHKTRRKEVAIMMLS